MPFTPKTWEDFPSLDTPLEASAIIDTEERLSDYTDSVAAGGVELGYANVTASTVTSSSSSYADISGLSTTVTVGTRPIEISFSAPSADNNAANGGVSVAILEDGALIGACGSLFNLASAQVSLNRTLRRAPSAGSHTYKCQLKRVFAGTVTLYADNFTALGPISLRVNEV